MSILFNDPITELSIVNPSTENLHARIISLLEKNILSITDKLPSEQTMNDLSEILAQAFFNQAATLENSKVEAMLIDATKQILLSYKNEAQQRLASAIRSQQSIEINERMVQAGSISASSSIQPIEVQAEQNLPSPRRRESRRERRNRRSLLESSSLQNSTSAEDQTPTHPVLEMTTTVVPGQIYQFSFARDRQHTEHNQTEQIQFIIFEAELLRTLQQLDLLQSYLNAVLLGPTSELAANGLKSIQGIGNLTNDHRLYELKSTRDSSFRILVVFNKRTQLWRPHMRVLKETLSRRLGHYRQTIANSLAREPAN